MKKKALCFSVTLACSLNISAAKAEDHLPWDAKHTCTVSHHEFESWFDGKVKENGQVTFADSAHFPLRNNCDFDKWSEQMFLWILSPEKDGKERVFDSSIFFTVSEEENKERHLIPHVPGKPRLLGTFRAQHGTNISIGQAGGGGVLMSQGGSIVYYSIDVNDVYAYFGANAKQTTPAPPVTTPETLPAYPNFPTSLDDLVFNGNPPPKFPDLKALAIELKTSWVEADSLTKQGLNQNNYVLIDAVIPNYQPSTTAATTGDWVIDAAHPTKNAKMALVGMHIVGSAKGHPEMIWATFEHKENSPNAPYPYKTKRDEVKWEKASTAGNWVFSKTHSTGPFNTELMTFQNSDAGGAKIVPTQFNSIGPSDTMRMNAWGTDLLNPEVETNNTEVISINTSVLEQLKSGDMRKNYRFIGSTWTKGGSTPEPNTNQVGASRLSNSTMETYQQFPTPGLNCFSCHQSGTTGGLNPDGLSHVFQDIKFMPGSQLPGASK